MMWKGVISLQKFWSQFNSNHKFGKMQGLEIFSTSFLVASCTLMNASTYPIIGYFVSHSCLWDKNIFLLHWPLCYLLWPMKCDLKSSVALRRKRLGVIEWLSLSVPSALKAACPWPCSLSLIVKVSSIAHSLHRTAMWWKAIDLDARVICYCSIA